MTMIENAGAGEMRPMTPRRAERRIPSDRELAARQANAARIATKVADLVASGHRVFDDAGDQVLRVVVGKGGDVIFTFLEGGSTILFMNDKTYDDGAMTTIPEFNASFEGWTYLHPDDIKPLTV